MIFLHWFVGDFRMISLWHQHLNYRAFYRFGYAKFSDGGFDLGSSQVSILPQLPQKMTLGLKGVKIGSKLSNSSR